MDSAEPRTWLRRLTGWQAAAAILVAFYVLMLVSLAGKGLTSDEIVHATAGYTYWRFDDYRLNPENGNLPQRVMAIPLVLGNFKFPATAGNAAWSGGDEWTLGDQWFHSMGNSVESMLFWGRAASGLMAVALGVLVWAASRRVFGPWGGMVSLLLFAFSPSFLANGALMTSDTACSLFFLAATLGIWSVLHRVSPGRLLASGLLTGGLFVSKMSAALILPIGIVLVVARLIEGRPLPVAFGRLREVTGRVRQAAVFAAVGFAHALLAAFVIWAFFGFRYAAFADASPGHERFNDTWEHITDKPLMGAVISELKMSEEQRRRVIQMAIDGGIPVNKWTPEALDFMQRVKRSVMTPEQAAAYDRIMTAPPDSALDRLLMFVDGHRMLPQAYVFGQAFSLKFTHKRGSFMNGHFGLFGWWTFFPYTVLVKTPVLVFGIALLAIWVALARPREGRSRLRAFYETLPFWTLYVFYWAALIPSHINIGHRHILATYPPFYVLCGAAAPAAFPLRRARAIGIALCTMLGLIAAEVLYRFPNYISYFNFLAGGPSNAYRHLVDSSLDWGQDLPGVRAYILDHRLEGRVYLSYFGSASPAYYKVPAQLLYSLGKPMELMNLPVDKAESMIPGILRDRPNYDVAATGVRGSVEAVMLLEKPDAFRLHGGTYFISATMLQPLEYEGTGPWGPWCARYEARYQELYPLAKPFLSDDNQARTDALSQGSVYDWMKALNEFDEYRFARFTAYLRTRKPDDNVGYSILVYKLTDADIARALDGPPILGPDVLKILEAKYGSAEP